MKYIILIFLFLIQIMTCIIGTTLMLIMNLNVPYKHNLQYPCITLFILGTIAFIITQILLNKWDNPKNPRNNLKNKTPKNNTTKKQYSNDNERN